MNQQEFTFHFVRFMQASISSATSIHPGTARRDGYSHSNPVAQWPNEVLTFCQHALGLAGEHMKPGVAFDQEKLMAAIREAHKPFVASLRPGNTQRIQDLNLEAFERFLSGDQVYG